MKIFTITSLSGGKHEILYMTWQTTEFVVLRSERIGSKRLILPWVGSCPGWCNGSALARKDRGPGSIPVPG